jgi:hypothetical protein
MLTNNSKRALLNGAELSSPKKTVRHMMFRSYREAHRVQVAECDLSATPNPLISQAPKSYFPSLATFVPQR